MQAQAKYMKAELFYYPRGVGREKFSGDKNSLADDEDLNTLVALAIVMATITTKFSKVKNKDTSNSNNEAEHFNFENLDISADSKW